jgi:hypothetical protein
MASVADVAISAFDSFVHILYQSDGNRFKGTYRPPLDIVGNVAYFPTVGQVTVDPYVSLAVINDQDPGFAHVECQLQGWYSSVAIGDLDRYIVNFNAISYSAETVIKAMGRKFDQLAIAALVAGYGSTIPIDTASTGQPNLTYQQLLKANVVLDNNGVPREGRYCAISASGMANLMLLEQFTNVFYAANKTVPGGTLDRSMSLGMEFIVIPDMAGGGLPLTTGTRSSFVWHRDALGGADAVNLRTRLDYLPQTDSNRVLAKFLLNTVAIDPRGIVRIQTTEA